MELPTDSHTILLVEPNPQVALDISGQLTGGGYSTLTARSEDEARQCLRAAPAIDLILMDPDLGPGCNCAQVARRLLQDRRLPLVFLVAPANAAEVARCEDVPAYGYVPHNAGSPVLLAALALAYRLHRSVCRLNESETRLETALAEQRAATAELEARSVEMNAFFEHSPDLVCFADFSGYFQRVNPSWEQVLGYSTTELTGRPFITFVHPDDQAATLDALAQVAAGESLHSFINRYRTRAGAYRWIEWRAQPLGHRILAMASDITLRKQIESTQVFLAQCTGQGQQFFEDLAPHLAELLHVEHIVIARLETGRQSVRSLIFFSHGQLQENITFRLDESVCADLLQNTLSSVPQGVRAQYPLGPLVNTVAAESFAGVALWGSDGQPVGLVAALDSHAMADPRPVESILRLVATRAAAELERKQADDALRASEERYRSLVEISPVAISMSDLEGKFITANQAALKQLGYSSVDELIASGQTTYGAIIEEDRPRAIQNAIRSLDGGEVRNIEYRVQARDGTLTPVEISASPIRNADGAPIAFIGISQDISERKAAEAVQARALAEKSTLLRDLQHRIKNSLMLITSLIVLEQQNAQQPETRTALEEIHDRVNSLAELYNILYESQNVQQIQLEQYLGLVANSLSASYLHDRTGITLHLNLEPLPVDARQATPFGLILNELLTNALKYAFPGETGGEITVRLYPDSPDLVLEVIDNGVGLPPGFDENECGAGLGLQLVRLLARQLNGNLACQTNHRTYFTVRVPFSEVAPP